MDVICVQSEKITMDFASDWHNDYVEIRDDKYSRVDLKELIDHLTKDPSGKFEPVDIIAPNDHVGSMMNMALVIFSSNMQKIARSREKALNRRGNEK
jgi:hypothetical protein